VQDFFWSRDEKKGNFCFQFVLLKKFKIFAKILFFVRRAKKILHEKKEQKPNKTRAKKSHPVCGCIILIPVNRVRFFLPHRVSINAIFCSFFAPSKKFFATRAKKTFLEFYGGAGVACFFVRFLRSGRGVPPRNQNFRRNFR